MNSPLRLEQEEPPRNNTDGPGFAPSRSVAGGDVEEQCGAKILIEAGSSGYPTVLRIDTPDSLDKGESSSSP